MEPELYNAAREGNHSLFEQIITNTGEEASYEQYFGSRTNEADNILHLAAEEGHTQFIEVALNKLPVLVLLVCHSNNHGENPLHVAAEHGHLEIAKLLVCTFRSYQQDVRGAARSSSTFHLTSVEEGSAAEPWKARDSHGETPLHKALKGGHEQLAIYLLGEDPELACYDNNEDVSPLFLASVNGHESFVKAILRLSTPYSMRGPSGATPLHAAVCRGTDKIVRLLLQKHPELIRKADSKKEIALHIAAKQDKVEFTELIMKADKSLTDQQTDGERPAAYQRDAEGFTPLLRAATLGLVSVTGVILRYSPQSVAICDSKGRTALHLMKLKSYQDGYSLLEFPVIKRLVNEPDLEGNTALHLAVGNQDHIMADILLNTASIQADVKNRKGLTPKDLIKSLSQPSDKMVEIGYRVIMQETHMQTSPQVEVVDSMTTPEETPQASSESIRQGTPIGRTEIHQRSHPQDGSKELQQSFNTLSTIAAILAAVTFAAIFAMPGGFNQNGEPHLARNTVFKVFMLSNASAMCGYVLVLFCVLWAIMNTQHGEEPRFLLTFSTHVLQLSFYSTLTAFATGSYTIISVKTFWLAIVLACLPACVVILTLPKFILYCLPKVLSRLCAWR